MNYIRIINGFLLSHLLHSEQASSSLMYHLIDYPMTSEIVDGRKNKYHFTENSRSLRLFDVSLR